MKYDIRYDIGDLVNVAPPACQEDIRRNPWTVQQIIVDQDRKVSYRLVSKDRTSWAGYYSEVLEEYVEIDESTRRHKIYVTDPEIVEMVKGMSSEERDKLARD